LALKNIIPVEFSRKPRSLLEFDRFKATEFRQLLLYLGPVIFHDCLDRKMYVHFLSLVVAVRILCSKKLHIYLNDYAKCLLLYFVENFGKLYGFEFVSYNVHNLVHICDDVKQFGTLDSFSCYKFKNYLQKLKHKVKATGNFLSQIVNRLTEESYTTDKKSEKIKYPIITFFNNTSDEIQ